MAEERIAARARPRNTIDYPLEQDTPGANALVVRPNPKEVEWWMQPPTPAKKAASLPVKARIVSGACTATENDDAALCRRAASLPS